MDTIAYLLLGLLIALIFRVADAIIRKFEGH